MRAIVSLLVLAVVAAVVPSLLLAPAAGAAQRLPAGFVTTSTATGQAAFALTDATYLPDGSVLTSGKDGTVTHVPVGGAPRTIAKIGVPTLGDWGLISLQAGADFETTRTVFTTRSRQAGLGVVQSLSRWTVTGPTSAPTGLTDEVELFSYPALDIFHNLGSLVVGADGTVWAAQGDSAPATRKSAQQLQAQNPQSPYGKLFHVTRDGLGVPGNPSYDAASAASWPSRTYASGFRSPFRASLDPVSGAPIVGDVGQDDREEVDLVRPGGNYGWPCREGSAPTPSYATDVNCVGRTFDAPLLDYPHTEGTSVTGGVVYQGTSYPEAYRGAYFFGDYSNQLIWTARFDATGTLVRDKEVGGFASEIGGPVRFLSGPNGDVVYADIYTGTLVRLSYTPGNRPPTASATATTTPATRTATFDGSASRDLDGDALTYAWDFGDGTTGTGVRPSHQYRDAAPRTATLTVTDAFGASGTTTLRVSPADNVPRVTVTGVAPGRTYVVGEQVSVTASATDVEDGNLSSQVRWTTQLRHCPSPASCHAHPAESGEGASFSLPFVDHGEDTVLVLTASVTDSAGVRASTDVVASPRLRTLTLAPSKPATMAINGNPVTTATVVVGSVNAVEAAAVATDGSSEFVSWSDGQPRAHDTVMPDRDLTLVASYTEEISAGDSPIAARYAADAALRALVGPPIGPEEVTAGLRTQVYQNGRVYWTAATGAKAVTGDILGEYLREGGPARLGAPTTDRYAVPGGSAQDLASGWAIYASGFLGAHVVNPPTVTAYRAAGGPAALGFPFTAPLTTPGGGSYVAFSSLSAIYESPATGAHVLPLPFFLSYLFAGGPGGALGYPVSNAAGAPARVDFQGGYAVADGFLGFPRGVLGPRTPTTTTQAPTTPTTTSAPAPTTTTTAPPTTTGGS